ncbi:MAG: hypothetical protein A2V98_12350 [Planctomycetes bacterium RBG_16_64_12]|nr:MAG: hypothetical protein A2V98_12350 [Planctomycetes bacterium RBG_16_64_12]
MELRFYEDPDTGRPHILNHGVTEDEVREVLANPGEDRPSSDDSRTALGPTAAGRYLRVIYVPDPGGDSAFVVTAYELQGKQLKAYRRRRRRRGK